MFMSFVTWNCQGASKIRLPATFKSIYVSNKVDLFVLVEPRVSGCRADRIIKKLGFPRSHRIEATGFSGGIWVLWKDFQSVEHREDITIVYAT